MVNFELQIPERRYACSNCGRCCQIFELELLPADIKRLAELDWTPDDPTPDEFIAISNGQQVIAHRDDDTCIFYDRNQKGCIIHQRFGYAAKPVGCRLYPFQLATTFPHTVSASIRFECPAARVNAGKTLRGRTRELRGMAEELGLPGPGFGATALNGLFPTRCRQIVSALLKRIIHANNLPVADRLGIAQLALARIEKLGSTFINDMDMDEILPSLFDRVTEDYKALPQKRMGAIEQARFLSLFLSYMRRDEEQVGQGVGGRLSRLLTLFNLLNGKVNLRHFSEEHPDFAISRTELFSTAITNGDDLEADVLFDLFEQRLTSYQFLGAPVYGRTFYPGLRGLFLLGALILALAKWLALTRKGVIGTTEITADDIGEATAAIHHSYGRSQLLGFGFMNTLHEQIAAPDAFGRVLDGIVNGGRRG